jgi:hypothetical protein
MGFMDILEQYAGQALAAQGDAHADFSKVAEQAPPDALGAGITQALRNGAGGSFATAIEKLFANSNPDQRAGLLTRLIEAAGPAVLSSIAGGALARFGGGAAAQVSPADANSVTPAQAGELANAAHAKDPGIVDRVGSFYSQHPMVVKALGAAALAVAMSHMARRT